MEMREERRENWGSRAAFVLAAVGSAVGLGNLWGFPYKVYDTGGGAFLIPYVIAMFLVGLPLLVVEFSVGHMTQRAAPDAFRSLRRRTEFVGWWQILLGFVIVTYYAVILAYCISFLGFSVQGIFTSGGELPWAGQGHAGVEKATNFFFSDYLNFSENDSLANIQWPIVGALALVWTMMYFCVFRGVKLVSKIVLWTVPLPWLMLLVLAVRGMTLDGADQGLKFFLEPNWSRLADPATWRLAFGQTFFTLSVGFGVMITYSSFLHRKSDINNNAAIIGLADLGTSFVAGIAVFATLGGMAAATQQSADPLAVQEVVKGGPSLAFVAFPYALAQLPMSAWFSLIFFSALLLLGLDSAFSITEAIIAGIVDKTGWSRGWVVAGIHVLGLGCGLVYCAEGGLTWLGTMDEFINGPLGIMLLGLIQCVVVGWMFRIRRLREHANERSDFRIGWWWEGLIRVVVPVILSALAVWNIYDILTTEGWFESTPNQVGLILFLLAPLAAVVIMFLRFKNAPDGGGTDPRPGAPALGGVVPLLAGIAALAAVAASFWPVLGIQSGGESDPQLVRSAWIMLGVAGGLGLVALLFGSIGFSAAESRGQRPSLPSRLASVLGTLGIGGGLGLGMSMLTLVVDIPVSKVDYTGELTATAYIILAAAGAIIVGGLFLCILLALRAAGSGPDEAQLPET